MKLLISVSVFVFGLFGSWLGGLLDHGNMFGGWSLFFGAVGSLAGIWIGYKAGSSWLG